MDGGEGPVPPLAAGLTTRPLPPVCACGPGVCAGAHASRIRCAAEAQVRPGCWQPESRESAAKGAGERGSRARGRAARGKDPQARCRCATRRTRRQPGARARASAIGRRRCPARRQRSCCAGEQSEIGQEAECTDDASAIFGVKCRLAVWCRHDIGPCTLCGCQLRTGSQSTEGSPRTGEPVGVPKAKNAQSVWLVVASNAQCCVMRAGPPARVPRRAITALAFPTAGWGVAGLRGLQGGAGRGLYAALPASTDGL
eukprot:7389143-Prymnesium_polylepis.2